MSESDSNRTILNILPDFSQVQEKVLGSDNKYIGIISAPHTPKPAPQQPYNSSQSMSQVNQNFHPSPQSFNNRAVHQISHVPPSSYSQRQNNNFAKPSYNNGNNSRVPPQHAQQQPLNSRTEVSPLFVPCLPRLS